MSGGAGADRLTDATQEGRFGALSRGPAATAGMRPRRRAGQPTRCCMNPVTKVAEADKGPPTVTRWDGNDRDRGGG